MKTGLCMCFDKATNAPCYCLPAKFLNLGKESDAYCEFSDSEHGIELSGDTNYWYESGHCRDVTVENCTFRNYNHVAGDYAVMICPIFNAAGRKSITTKT